LVSLVRPIGLVVFRSALELSLFAISARMRLEPQPDRNAGTFAFLIDPSQLRGGIFIIIIFEREYDQPQRTLHQILV
jgi:hypothetical protein